MNSPNDSDFQKRLQDLETEINQNPSSPGGEPRTVPVAGEKTVQWRLIVTQMQVWFQQLPLVGKIVVGVGGVIVTFSLLSTVLKLVASLITIAILVAILYILYKVFMAPSPKE